ncbi:MAG TPA: DoxX family protein [Gemmatimonadaceae bacterium]
MPDLARFEWLGVLLARIAIGLVFMISGSGKLWRADKRAAMLETLEDAHVPAARFNARFVPAVELCFGTLLLLGALTPIACVMLSGVMLVALLTTQIQTIKATRLSDWLASFLYLPEVLYLLILILLFFSGPGWLSVDHLLFSRSRPL